MTRASKDLDHPYYSRSEQVLLQAAVVVGATTVLEVGLKPSYPYQKGQLQTSRHTFREDVRFRPQGHCHGTHVFPASLLSSFEHHAIDLERHPIPRSLNRPRRLQTGYRPSCT